MEGDYFFVSRSLGSMFGTIDGVGVWLAMLLKTAIALIGMGAYLGGYLHLPLEFVAAAFCIVFLVTNIVGTKEAGALQAGMVALLFGLLLCFFVFAIPKVRVERFTPFAPFGMEAMLSTTGFVFISYIGLTKIASIAEEVRNPERNIPLGLLLALGVVLVVYAVGVGAVVGILPAEILYRSMTPLSDAARLAAGSTGALLITVAALLAFATTANAGLMSASRYLLAMGRDRVVPHALSRLTRAHTPRNALCLSAGIVLVFIFSIGIEQIAKLASTFQLLVFAFVHISVLVMRESGIQSYDPGFRSPLYPYMQIIGIAVSVILIPQMGLLASVMATALVALGVVWFNVYVRRRIVMRVGAVGMAAERVAERLLERDAHALGLDRELREILKEKGLRADDPFQQIVRNALFMEVAPGMTSEHVLRRGATLLSGLSGVSEDLIAGALLERSQLGETPAEAGIALPHVLLNEVEGFHLVAARCATGMEFPMAHQAIHAAFLLLGSRRDPAQHLRFLAEIARRAEDPGFIDRWIQADSSADLREILSAEPAAPVRRVRPKGGKVRESPSTQS